MRVCVPYLTKIYFLHCSLCSSYIYSFIHHIKYREKILKLLRYEFMHIFWYVMDPRYFLHLAIS